MISSGFPLAVVRVAIIIITGVLVLSSLALVIEPQTILLFHRSVYFIVMSIATVGYGDLAMKSIGNSTFCFPDAPS